MAGFKLEWFGDTAIAKFEREAEKIVDEVMRDELEVMNRTAPKDSGRMIRESRVRGSGLQREIVYPTEYAIPVHERLGVRHAAPRRAKWAELTHLEEEAKSLRRIGQRLDQLLSKKGRP